MTSDDLVDLKRLEDLRRITNKEDLARLLASVRAYVEKTRVDVEAGVETAPFATLAALLHASVGASAVVGAKRLCAAFAACKALPATSQATWSAFGQQRQ